MVTMTDPASGVFSSVVPQFRDRGYARLPRLFSRDEIDDVRAHLDRVIRDVLPTMDPNDYVLEPGGGAVRNLWRLEHYEPYFAELGNTPWLLDIIGRLLDGDPLLIAVETFNKPARQGTAVPPHQDNAYFCQVPPDVLTVWVAIDPTTDHNGPVNYLADTQDVLLPHEASGTPGNSMVLIEPPAAIEAARAERGLLEPGDAMVHHSQTIHWSEPNRTDQPRCGMLLVYRAVHTRTSPQLRAIYTAAQTAFAALAPA
jgi:phytanoyl-CoA hydroxylase